MQDLVPPAPDLPTHLKMRKIKKMTDTQCRTVPVLLTMFTWRRTKRIMMTDTIVRWKMRMTLKDTIQLKITMKLSFQKSRMRISKEMNDFKV